MGILTCRSAFCIQKSVRPVSSVPTAMASGSFIFTSVYICVADGVAASTRILLDLSQVSALADSTSTVGTVKTAPLLARITLGFHKSTRGSQTSKASTCAASAVRKIAPKLPGFSTDSATITNGDADNEISSSLRLGMGKIPSHLGCHDRRFFRKLHG